MSQPMRTTQRHLVAVQEPRRRSWRLIREAMSTWPSLNVTIRLLPWQWRWYFWNDWDCTLSWTADMGLIKIEFWANKPLFVLDA